MPTYKINPQPGPLALQQNQFAQRLISSALDNMSELEMKKKLSDYEKENQPVEKVATSELQKRHDKLQEDLITQREDALQNADVNKLKVIDKAQKDLDYLEKVLRDRALEEAQTKLKTKQDLDLGAQKIEAERQLAEERKARASIFSKFGPGKDPFAGVKVTMQMYKDLVAEKNSILQSIRGYTSKYMPIPEDMQLQLDALDVQIDAVKEKLKIKQPKPGASTNKATSPTDITGASDQNLLDMLQ